MRPRVSPARRVRRGMVLAALAVAAWALVAMPVGAQEEEDLGAELREMRSAFDRARERIDDLDFNGAIRLLGRIIKPRQGARSEDLELEELEMLSAAYALRARAHFNTGQSQLAKSDYSSLLQLNTAFVIDRRTLSPKVVALFDEVRRGVAGTLLLEVEPPRVRVLVDGIPIELEESGITLLAGDRELRLEREGFDPHVERLRVLAGSQIQKTVRLRPNRRALQFITAPAGVTVSIDGEVVGVSKGPASPDVAALAEQYGFEPATASAPLRVPLVSPGTHRVTFERECFQPRSLTVKVTLDLDRNAPLRFAPLVLKESRTDLLVRSTPPGSLVLIDGEEKGSTPVTISGMCGGEHGILVVKPGVGTWSERVMLETGRSNSLDVRLRPTLLYAGTFRLDDWGRAIWSDQDRLLLDRFDDGLSSLNLVRTDDVLSEIRTLVIDSMILDPGKVRAGELLSPAVLKEVADRSQADLILVGLTLANDPKKTWRLALYSTEHRTPDRVKLRIDRPRGVADFVRRLDSALADHEAWWGFSVVDSLLPSTLGASKSGAAPVVVRVLPGSPAATEGLRAGDRVRLAGERTVRSARQIVEALAGAEESSGAPRIDLLIEGVTGRRTVSLAAARSSVVLPVSDPTLLYNRALAEFLLRSRTATSEEARGAALMNLGIAYMHYREYDAALARAFRKASLPAGPGISRGTLDYYRGLCALRKGDPGKARSAFEEAATAEWSTLGSGDGPEVGAAARRMLLALD